MTLSSFLAWFAAAVSFGTVILYGCLGETLNQKAGGLNLGVPGIMMMGGIGAIIGAFLYETNGGTSGFVSLIISLICCLLMSVAGGLIYAFLTITLRVNQNVTGLTLTMFGSGLANFFGGILIRLSGGAGQISLPLTSLAYRTRIPILSTKLGIVSDILFSYGIMVYVAIILAVILHWFLNRTRTGLNLRAIGENPATADACGINVTRYKYLASIIGAAIAGLGALFYVMDYVKGTWNNDGGIEALGWLALALVIFSSWKPLKAISGSYVFGACYWIYLYMPAFINNALTAFFRLNKSTYLQNMYKAIPYIVTIVVLVITSKGKRAVRSPGSLGISYFREER
ncbi:MAG: ABC transporter permease [Erysipelotrichaceae bacterium]|nr:ABC transporter permease [Erysipelotrichaceae bacterium]